MDVTTKRYRNVQAALDIPYWIGAWKRPLQEAVGVREVSRSIENPHLLRTSIFKPQARTRRRYVSPHHLQVIPLRNEAVFIGGAIIPKSGGTDKKVSTEVGTSFSVQICADHGTEKDVEHHVRQVVMDQCLLKVIQVLSGVLRKIKPSYSSFAELHDAFERAISCKSGAQESPQEDRHPVYSRASRNQAQAHLVTVTGSHRVTSLMRWVG